LRVLVSAGSVTEGSIIDGFTAVYAEKSVVSIQ
jgi:hypothetical protein